MNKALPKPHDQEAAPAIPEPPKNGWTESYAWLPARSDKDETKSWFQSSCHLGFGRARD